MSRALGSQHAAALALVGVLDGIGLHLEADDARAREGVRLVVLHDEAQVVVLVGVRVMVRVGVRVEVGWRVGPGLRVRMMVGVSEMVGVGGSVRVGSEQRAHHVGGARLRARDVLAADEAQPEAAVQGKAQTCEQQTNLTLRPVRTVTLTLTSSAWHAGRSCPSCCRRLTRTLTRTLCGVQVRGWSCVAYRSYMSFLVPSGISAIILVAAGRLSMIMWMR